MCKLPDGHVEAEIHRSMAEALEEYCLFDQYDISNSAGSERCCKQMVLQEYIEKRRTDAAELTANTSGTSKVERGVILGNKYSRGQNMIPPQFAQWISQQLTSEADLQKAARKLREEHQSERDRLKQRGNYAAKVTPG